MLRLQNHLLYALRAARHLPVSSLHRRLLSTATTATATATASATSQFVAEDYLVAACGLTPAQAHKASKYLPHLKSHDNPDAVRAFLSDTGLAKDDVAAAISRDPRLLCSRVDKTLTPRLDQLREIGLSPSQISRLITIVPSIFIQPVKISRLAFYVSFVGSYDKVHAALRRHAYLLGHNLENVVEPNLAYLQQCGLTPCDVAKVFVLVPRLLTSKLERVKEIVAHAKKLGVPRHSAMFKHALNAVYCLSDEKISAKMDLLKMALGCSKAEVAIAVRKLPCILKISEGKLARNLEFLKMEVGLQPRYIVYRPALLFYSMEMRLMPRHYIIKVLKAKGLVKKDVDFYAAVSVIEEKFVEKFIDHFRKSLPGLADAYAAACAGKTPPGANCEDLEI